MSTPELKMLFSAHLCPRCAALTAYNALQGPTPLKGGDWVLVQGTGGVSIFGLQIAAASGANVIVTSSSDEKLEQAKKLGAHYTINYKETPDWEEEVLKIVRTVRVMFCARDADGASA